MVSKFSLEGKIAIVTGGSRGIGRSIALAYAEAGADLVIASRTQKHVNKVVDEVKTRGRRGIGVLTDVSKSQDVTALVAATLEAYGRIDILVNNAGISPVYTRSLKLKEQDWDRILAVNLKGAFLCCQAVGRVMVEQRKGKVINIISVGATTGLPKFVAYCAAKGGLLQITRVLAQEWAEYNVQVNAISPGYIETDMTEGLENTPWMLDEIIRRTPMRRLGKTDEIVGAAQLLASSASSYMTGSVISVDGGWVAA